MANWWDGPITQGFGPTDEPLDSGYNGYAHFNKGLDFGIPTGTPITSNIGGTVISAGDSGDGWGISVKVRDASGNTHNYGHLSAADVSPGQKVTAGDLLGKSGSTGASTGPHLSYDVWNSSGTFIEPSHFVGKEATEGIPTSSAAIASNGRALTSAGVSLLPNNAGVKLDMPDGTTQQYDPADITDALIAQMANELGQLSITSPTVKDYATQNLISPAQALSELRLNGLTQLQSLETSAQQLRMYKNGFVADPTGKYIISVNSLDPQARAQADAINQQTWTGIQNTYLKDQYGLNADRITSLFNSQVAGVNSSLSYDQNALTRANSLINRQLAGKQEADARAKFVTDTLTSLAPWATGGKTEFTGNDFGAIGAEFAKAAGMDPNATALKFPGSVTVNPSSLLDLYDQQMGTSGPLPGVPDMLTNPSLLGQISGGMNLPPAPSLFGASPIPAATGPQTTDLDSLLNQFATAGKGPTTVLPGSNFNISSLLQALKGFGG